MPEVTTVDPAGVLEFTNARTHVDGGGVPTGPATE